VLANGMVLPAEIKKFSAPLLTDVTGKPVADSGRDLALLRVKEGNYPAIGLPTREGQIGDPVHILGFPGVVLSHELLNKSATLEASVTNGTVSGFKMDAIGQDLVQTDAAAAHGNSGGPAGGGDLLLIGGATFLPPFGTGFGRRGIQLSDSPPRRPHVHPEHRGAGRGEQVQPGVGRRHRRALHRTVYDRG